MSGTFDFSTSPYVHTQRIAPIMTYSGNSCIQPQQWGFIDIDPIARTSQMKSGVGKNMAGFQPPKITIIGDCWQSGTQVAASAGARKWVLVIGTPPMCAAGGTPVPALAVQIWKWENANWVWKGQVGSNSLYAPTPTGKIGIAGDFGYVRELHGGIPPPPFLWSKIDLATLTIVETGIPEASLPPLEAQPGLILDGSTWALSKIGNPALYRVTKTGGGIVLPTYCPDDKVRRGEMAVFLLKTKYGSAYTPPPATGTMFSDVPITHQFAAWIEQLAKEGITAGKSPCTP